MRWKPRRAGSTVAFSWRTLITGRGGGALGASSLCRHPAGSALRRSAAGRRGDGTHTEAASRLGLTPDKGVKVRLTGSVVLSDEEFASIVDGAALNGAVTLLLVVLRAVARAEEGPHHLRGFHQSCGRAGASQPLSGFAMVGALNLISVAFAVLFIGLGVDFGIQFSVRYRAERHAAAAISSRHSEATGRGVAATALLAAASIAAAFYSFLPTAYVGLSELGLIAGTGMIIAFADHGHSASRAACGAQAVRRAGADRLGLARAAGPFSGTAAQLDRRPHAGRRRSWPAAARGLALRLQSAQSAAQNCRSRFRHCST